MKYLQTRQRTGRASWIRAHTILDTACLNCSGPELDASTVAMSFPVCDEAALPPRGTIAPISVNLPVETMPWQRFPACKTWTNPCPREITRHEG